MLALLPALAGIALVAIGLHNYFSPEGKDLAAAELRGAFYVLAAVLEGIAVGLYWICRYLGQLLAS